MVWKTGCVDISIITTSVPQGLFENVCTVCACVGVDVGLADRVDKNDYYHRNVLLLK